MISTFFLKKVASPPTLPRNARHDLDIKFVKIYYKVKLPFELLNVCLMLALSKAISAVWNVLNVPAVTKGL